METDSMDCLFLMGGKHEGYEWKRCGKAAGR